MVDEHATKEAGAGVLDAARALQNGKAIVIPTDTVYGLAVAVAYTDGPDLLYKIKGRPGGKPVSWLVASEQDLDAYGEDVPDYARRMAHDFWPGPLTIVVKASERVPQSFRSSEGTIGLRVPEDEMARGLAMRVRSPLATSSANMAGQKAPHEFAAIDPEIIAQASIVLEDDALKGGIASTVVDCTGAQPTILREGPITAADIDPLVW